MQHGSVQDLPLTAGTQYGAHTSHAIHAVWLGSLMQQVPNVAQYGAHISHSIHIVQLGSLLQWVPAWLSMEPIHPMPSMQLPPAVATTTAQHGARTALAHSISHPSTPR